jgi:predicted nucleic acid-binding Zn ribbon protein
MLVMTKEEEHAYNWAREQQFQSVAARYARVLAGYIQRCNTSESTPTDSSDRAPSTSGSGAA